MSSLYVKYALAKFVEGDWDERIFSDLFSKLDGWTKAKSEPESLTNLLHHKKKSLNNARMLAVPSRGGR